MVSLGDSLTAGAQDGSYTPARVAKSYPKQIADQADIDFQQPRISERGIQANTFDGNTLSFHKTLVSKLKIAGAEALIKPYLKKGKQPPPTLLRPLKWATNVGEPESELKQNLAVPGAEARQLIEISDGADVIEDIIAGGSEMRSLHDDLPYVENNLTMSQLDGAVTQSPDLVTVWIGGNDIIGALGSGHVDDATLTPMETRRWRYKRDGEYHNTASPVRGLKDTISGGDGIITRLLAETEAEIMLLNMPDVGELPILRPIGQKLGKLPFKVEFLGKDVTSILEDVVVPALYESGEPIPRGSHVTLFKVLGELPRILMGRPLESLDPDDVVDPTELAQVEERLHEYNAFLKKVADQNDRVHLVDIFAVTREAANGLKLRGAGPDASITNTFASMTENGHNGWFSLDGVHPSDIGHTIIANRVLDVVKSELDDSPRFQPLLSASPIDEKEALRQDPHAPK